MNKKIIEQYICFCSKIKKTEYEKYLKKNPKLSLEQIFNSLKIGINCAACRIELEKVFITNNITKRALEAESYYRKPLNLIKNIFSYNSIYINKKILKQTGPILSGQDIKNELIVSNFSIDGFSKYVVPFQVNIFIRDEINKKSLKKQVIVKPETRLIYEFNLKKQNERKILDTAGYFTIEIQSKKRGYIGVTRPHLRVSSKNSLSTIHLQHGRSKPISYVAKIQKDEIQYLSLINLKNLDNNFTISVVEKNKTKSKFNFCLKALSSTLINLNNLTKNLSQQNNKIIFFIEHYGILRRNVIIYSKLNNTLSLDHI